MKISELMALLAKRLEQSGDIQAVVPLDTGDYAPIDKIEVEPMFLQGSFDPVYRDRPRRGQGMEGHEHVAILRWD